MKNAEARINGCQATLCGIVYLRVVSEQYSHSAQLAFQQELLLSIPLGFGQIAPATLQFVPQPAQSLLKYFL